MEVDLGKKINARFAAENLGEHFLDGVVEWIGDNLDPDDVFRGHKLDEWAYDNGFKKFE
jgi:hypothetical protein